ncbi:SCO2400 family protein [Streptomyces sp. WMMC897]|uniref:SCO2400 family protein n=1 Tax=Streptomyces sp. WMMC897 TaxID=3014782 RepID=UPI003FCECFB3
MDYCSLCRRHVNGALACPGCGAAARRTAPVAPPGEGAVAPAGQEGRPTDDEAVTEPAEGRGAPVPVGGRAARRRQLARQRKYQRRALVATAIALVGGGVSAVTLQSRPSTGLAQAGSSAQEGSGPAAAGAQWADEGGLAAGAPTTGDGESGTPSEGDPASGTDATPEASPGADGRSPAPGADGESPGATSPEEAPEAEPAADEDASAGPPGLAKGAKGDGDPKGGGHPLRD